MALNDLTNQNIQDTYQKVVQTDGTNLADGTGSALPIKFEGPDLIVSGALRANSYIVSESITSVSSGSTIFGNSEDDTHTFEGNVTSSGNIRVGREGIMGTYLNGGGEVQGVWSIGQSTSGTVYKISETDDDFGNLYGLGYAFNGNGGSITGLNHQFVLVNNGTVNGALSFEGHASLRNITSSGTISASGKIQTSGTISSSAGITASDASFSGNISASGNISSSGYVQTGELRGETSTETAFQVNGWLSAYNITGSIISASDNVICKHLNAHGEKGSIMGSITRVGSGVNAKNARLILYENTEHTVNISSVFDNYISGSSVRLGIGTKLPSASLTVEGNLQTRGSDPSGGGHITASGNISSSGTLTADTILTNKHQISEGISQTGTSTGYQIESNFIVQPSTLKIGNISSSGDISASGNVYGNRFYIDGNEVLRYSSANSGLYVAGGIQTIGKSSFGNDTADTHTFIGNITCSNFNSLLTHHISASSQTLNHLIINPKFGVGGDGEGEEGGNIGGSGMNTNASTFIVGPDFYVNGTGSINNITNINTTNISASGNISSSKNLIVSQSITFGAASSIIGREGGDDFIRFENNDTAICMDSVPVIEANHSGPADGQIILNASNQDIDVKITFDDGTNALQTDAGNNRIYLRDYVSVGSGSVLTPTGDALTVSGSQYNVGHITASGNISASGDISTDTLLVNKHKISEGISQDGTSGYQVESNLIISPLNPTNMQNLTYLHLHGQGVTTSGEDFWFFPKDVGGTEYYKWEDDTDSVDWEATSFTLPRQSQHKGIMMPYDCWLIGFQGVSNASGNHQSAYALWEFQPHYGEGGSGGTTATRTHYGESNISLLEEGGESWSPSNNYASKPGKVVAHGGSTQNVDAPVWLTEGTIIVPSATNTVDGGGEGTHRISMTIILQVPFDTVTNGF